MRTDTPQPCPNGNEDCSDGVCESGICKQFLPCEDDVDCTKGVCILITWPEITDQFDGFLGRLPGGPVLLALRRLLHRSHLLIPERLDRGLASIAL